MSTAALLEQETIGVWQRCTLAVVDLSDVAFIDTTVINYHDDGRARQRSRG